ncbi:hypothetical protein C2G38_2059189 [Gigaspora rosea]|uniref:Uncharacterized protein n=1 Tax=Gigaspora rosea TaxID=44941 RepID=A0A397W162_9GLOM|nr:hypothetical protein C2G38_2059189 [Gigaspora rosea]
MMVNNVIKKRVCALTLTSTFLLLVFHCWDFFFLYPRNYLLNNLFFLTHFYIVYFFAYLSSLS